MTTEYGDQSPLEEVRFAIITPSLKGSELKIRLRVLMKKRAVKRYVRLKNGFPKLCSMVEMGTTAVGDIGEGCSTEVDEIPEEYLRKRGFVFDGGDFNGKFGGRGSCY